MQLLSCECVDASIKGTYTVLCVCAHTCALRIRFSLSLCVEQKVFDTNFPSNSIFFNLKKNFVRNSHTFSVYECLFCGDKISLPSGKEAKEI